jgi:hypothetical protein
VVPLKEELLLVLRGPLVPELSKVLLELQVEELRVVKVRWRAWELWLVMRLCREVLASNLSSSQWMTRVRLRGMILLMLDRAGREVRRVGMVICGVRVVILGARVRTRGVGKEVGTRHLLLVVEMLEAVREEDGLIPSVISSGIERGRCAK